MLDLSHLRVIEGIAAAAEYFADLAYNAVLKICLALEMLDERDGSFFHGFALVPIVLITKVALILRIVGQVEQAPGTTAQVRAGAMRYIRREDDQVAWVSFTECEGHVARHCFVYYAVFVETDKSLLVTPRHELKTTIVTIAGIHGEQRSSMHMHLLVSGCILMWCIASASGKLVVYLFFVKKYIAAHRICDIHRNSTQHGQLCKPRMVRHNILCSR
mmetsp:Transcript_115615/g.180640  ORF Transcript_115615/g.180640 Transcript_115615/m.180640 type:complete len:217 (-) Transcript_115615:59-709(-)